MKQPLHESSGQTRKPGTTAGNVTISRPVGNIPIQKERLLNVGSLPKVKK